MVQCDTSNTVYGDRNKSIMEFALSKIRYRLEEQWDIYIVNTKSWQC